MRYPRGVFPAARLGVTVVLAIVTGLAFTACGDDDESGGGGEASEEEVAQYDQRLEELYEGTYTEPTGPPVEAEPGKNVWLVTLGQDIEAAQLATAAMEDAAPKLDWDVTVFDGKFDPSRQLAGVEQALADGADGIVTAYIDCANIKTGLQRAKEQGVPVVAMEGLDCDPGLFTHGVLYAGDEDFITWVHGWGAAQAAWLIAETDGEAKVILSTQTDFEVGRSSTEGVMEELEKCPTCEVLDTVEFVGAELGPDLQQKIEQAFIEHPEANAFIANYDDVLTLGGAQALRGTGRVEELHVVGGEGQSPSVKLIYDGVVDACVGFNGGHEAYGAVDALVRIFAGRDPAESNTGLGEQVCDREHNLPPEGEPYQPPIDYVAAYEEKWGVE